MQVARCVTTYFCALVLVSASLAAFEVEASAAGRERTYVVNLKDGVAANDQGPKLGRKYKGRTGEVFDAFGSFVFQGTANAARAMSRDRRVAVVEPDVTYRIADSPGDAAHLKRTAVPKAFDAGYTGQGVTIAMLDTGVKRNHVVFSAHNNIEGGKSCVGGGTGDHEGHGTASASNAVGRIGVAHAAKLIPVKIFPRGSLSTSLQRVICGLNWVRKHNENNPGHIDVVNMSISGPGSEGLRRAVKKLGDQGVVMTAAAGNHDGALRFPARYGAVIAVSALASGKRMAAFSAHGAALTAPGVSIFSAENDSNNAFSRRTGTSRSAPQVAGAAAVVLAEDPTADVKAVLKYSGKCPNGEINGDTGPCPGRWRGDEDRRAEPLINAYCAGVRANPVDTDITTCGF